MAGMERVVISSRFLLTMGHLIAIVLTLWSYRSNVWVGLDDNVSNNEISEAEQATLVSP